MQLPEPPPPMSDTPLFYRPPEVKLCRDAVLNGDRERVRELVQQLLHRPRPLSEGLKPDPRWLNGSVSIAIERNDLEMVRFLLDENVADPDTATHFETAVRSRAFDILELLLQRGWDINKPRNEVYPPMLSIPLCLGDEEMVSWLLDHGADPNAGSILNETPTSQAMFAAPLHLIEDLFTRGSDAQRGELLQHAILRRKPDALQAVKLAVEHGAPINKLKYEDDPSVFWEREPFGLGAPLHRAAELGKLDIVEYLLERGADPLKLDSRGKRPSYWADVKVNADVAAVLLHAEEQWSKTNTMSNL